MLSNCSDLVVVVVVVAVVDTTNTTTQELAESQAFVEGLAVIKNMGAVVDSLFVRTGNLRF